MSHETIYQALFVQAKGQLTARLVARLRSGRVRRLSRTERRAIIEKKQVIPDMIMITERPAEAADRAVPGHREDDLIMGKGNRSAIAILVERASHFVLLARLLYDHTAKRTAYARTAAMSRLPALLKRSLAWDQGREMAQHTTFTTSTGIPDVLLQPACAVAARHQRKHQWPAPRVLPEAD